MTFPPASGLFWRGRVGALHDDGERHEPAAGLAFHGRGHDPGRAVLNPAGKFPHRLVRPDKPNAGQAHVMPPVEPETRPGELHAPPRQAPLRQQVGQKAGQVSAAAA